MRAIRVIVAVGLMLAVLAGVRAEGEPVLCFTPVGAFDGVWYRWAFESQTVKPDTLKCKYDAELASAPAAGACLTYFTDVQGSGWLRTVERVNAAGQLVCKYELYSTPEVRGFRASR